MIRHDVPLRGVTPEPLSRYLTGLAVLRLVASQADPGATAHWGEECLILSSALDEEGLLGFFMDEYVPTPIVSPWNGGSGFYAGDPSVGIDAIMGTADSRLAPYRAVIEAARSWPEMPRSYSTAGEVIRDLKAAIARLRPGKKRGDLEDLLAAVEAPAPAAAAQLALASLDDLPLADLEARQKQARGALAAYWKAVKKARTQCLSAARGGSKEEILAACRARLPDAALPWIDAVFALGLDGSPTYNPVVGSGGNEGHLDFSNNFQQRLAELLLGGDPAASRRYLGELLFADVIDGLERASIGQFNPGRAGGFNQGPEVETKAFTINPWEFVLMLEGATALAGSYMKRGDPAARGYAAVPFTVRFTGVGYASAETSEKGRAETWLPLWRRPVGQAELSHLFREGRAMIGRRPAQNGIDFLRAIGTLGVDRGIDSFVRFAFIERRGTNYVALPAGRFKVFERPTVRLLDDLDPLLASLESFLRGFPNVPATYGSAWRKLERTVFDCAARPDPRAFQRVLAALGALAALAAERDRAKDPKLTRPLRGLRPEWIEAADDGSVEVRIAAALASIGATGKVGPMASLMAGADPGAPWEWARGRSQRRWEGSTLAERLAGVLARRLLLAEQLGVARLPLEAPLTLHPHDVVAFLYGDTDDGLIEELLWGMTAIAWRRTDPAIGHLHDRWRGPVGAMVVPRAWSLLKLLFVPGGVRGVNLAPEPRTIPLLLAGRVAEAAEIARRRLAVEGLAPLPVRFESVLDGTRLAAGLLIPVSRRRLLASQVLAEETNERDENVR